MQYGLGSPPPSSNSHRRHYIFRLENHYKFHLQPLQGRSKLCVFHCIPIKLQHTRDIPTQFYVLKLYFEVAIFFSVSQPGFFVFVSFANKNIRRCFPSGQRYEIHKFTVCFGYTFSSAVVMIPVGCCESFIACPPR